MISLRHPVIPVWIAGISKQELECSARNFGWTEFRSRERSFSGLNIFMCNSKREVASRFKCTVVELKEDVMVKSQEFPLGAGEKTADIPDCFSKCLK